MSELPLISKKDLSLIEDNSLNAKQLQFILKRTPPQYVKSRPAKGGGTWQFVSGGYVRKCLNLMFGFDWDFEILSQDVFYGEVVVKGKLTCRCNGKVITKTQFGNKEIVYKKQPNEQGEKMPLSIGNDMKAAATDALKKCAAEIGIAADIYNSEDFREVNVDVNEVTIETLQDLYLEKHEKLSKEDDANICRIIKNEETKSYSKAFKTLNDL